jgi:molybdopterin molybdotransferase
MNKGLLSVDEALAQLLAGVKPVSDVEIVPTLQAIGRVLARPVQSTMNVPPMDNSAMDGYAVRASDIGSPGARLKVSQRIPAGAVGQALIPGTAARIFTGAPIPAGADAIVMQEDTETIKSAEGEDVVVNKPPRRGDWVRVAGLDIPAGEAILATGTRLRPEQVGLAASVGIASLPVFRRLRVGLIFPGDELAMPGETLKPGSIYNSNRFTLTGLAQALGCEVRDYGIVPDGLAVMRDVLRRAAGECDIVVTNGGVSVGEADFVKPAVEAEGELLMWRIAMKPGRPLAYGKVGNAAFIGLPGNPVSCFVTFLWFVRPFVMRTQGISDVTPRRLQVRADFDWLEPDARREFLRARWNERGGLDLYRTQDSAVLSSTAWASGLIDNPPKGIIRKGDSVSFVPYSELWQ